MYAQKRQEGQELLEAAKAELEELFKTQEKEIAKTKRKLPGKFLKCKSRVESTWQQLYNYNKLFENCRYTANLILGYIQKKLLQANPGEKTLIDKALRWVKKKISQSVIEQLGQLKFDFEEYVGQVWYWRDQAEDERNLLKKLKHCQTENQITTAGLGKVDKLVSTCHKTVLDIILQVKAAMHEALSHFNADKRWSRWMDQQLADIYEHVRKNQNKGLGA